MRENQEVNTEDWRDEQVSTPLTQEPETTELDETTEQAPLPADLALLETDELFGELIEKMTQCGMTYADAEANIVKRKKSFQQAMQWKNTSKWSKQTKEEDVSGWKLRW